MRPVLLCLVVLAAGCAERTPVKPGPETDAQVLGAALRSLFQRGGFGTGETAVLHYRTPESAPYVTAQDIEHDADGRPLPADALANLVSRNRRVGPKGVRFGAMKLGPSVVVGDAFKKPRPDDTPGPWVFRGYYPKAACYLAPFLPGYSSDGRTAIVAGDAGPTMHGASAIFILKLRDGKWAVIWQHVAVGM